MTRVCLICSHPKRLQIDQAIVQGATLAKIARDFDVPPNSLYPHSKDHLSRQLAQAYQRKEALESLNLLGEIEDLLHRTKVILTQAEQDKRYTLALKAIAEARGVYELLSRIAFSLHQARTAELELERAKAHDIGQEAEMEFQEALKVLTMPELELLEKLSEKIQKADPKIKILPEALDRWDVLVERPSPSTGLETKPEPETTLEPIEESPSPDAVQPIKPIEIQPYQRKGNSLPRLRL